MNAARPLVSEIEMTRRSLEMLRGPGLGIDLRVPRTRRGMVNG